MRNTIQGWYSVLYQASNWCVRYTNSGFCHMCRQLEIQYLSKTSFIDTYKKASRLTFVMLQLDIKETFLKCNCNFSCRPNIETRWKILFNSYFYCQIYLCLKNEMSKYEARKRKFQLLYFWLDWYQRKDFWASVRDIVPR